MKRPDPFSPVPLSRGLRPIVLRRDRRARDLDEHLTPAKTEARIGGIELLQFRLIVVLIAMFAIVLARVAYLQIAQGGTHRSASERNRVRLETILAPRGIILDRHGQTLLNNVPNFTLIATPADLPPSSEERRAIADELTKTFPLLNHEYVQNILLPAPRGSLQPITLSEHVGYQSAIRLSTVIARMPGISLETLSTRSYTSGSSFAHVIGYLGKPTADELAADPQRSSLSAVGRMGIEQYYDQVLRGKDGVREVERDHLNKELNVIANREAVPGNNLVLTLDRRLQETLSTALRTTVKRLRVPGGAAIALDPRTGQVLALVSEPSFDPNLFTQGGDPKAFDAIFQDPNHPLFFRTISGTYPSGSTIKPVIAAAGLAEGIINERTTVNSVGGITVGPNFFPDWKQGGHGITDVRKALAESVNTFFFVLGGGFEDRIGLGVDRIVHYLQRFGLGSKLGIDLPNEASGFLPTAEWRKRPGAGTWYLGDTYYLAIGQGYVNVTPLQVATYTAAIANGGTLFQPHLLKTILTPEGSVERQIAPNEIGKTVDARTLAIVRSGMREAVLSGSARALGDLPVAVGAKTGTAQFGNDQRTHAWLTSFAPYDRPEIVVTVVIEEGGEGFATALPVAKQALAEYYGRQR